MTVFLFMKTKYTVYYKLIIYSSPFKTHKLNYYKLREFKQTLSRSRPSCPRSLQSTSR